MTLPGVLDVRFIPTWKPSTIKGLLRQSLRHAELLQGAIAYWTIQESILGSHLARALSGKNGYVCVDLHPPTDVDRLAELAQKGGGVRLYCEDITTYTDNGRKEPPHLVHTKLLLFWSKDKTAELWVGSHNWTKRAIGGLNVEASLVVKMQDSSPLFAEAADYLQRIKEISEPFDLSQLDFYKEAQRWITGRRTPFIDFETPDAAMLEDSTIRLFGTNVADHDELTTIGKEVYVAAFDSNSGEECLYPAAIQQSGLMAAANPAVGSISFASPTRYSLRQHKRLPALLPPGPVPATVYNQAHYYVTLTLGRRDTESTVIDVPERAVVWTDDTQGSSPLISRLDAESLKFIFGPRTPRVRHPELQRDFAPPATLEDRRRDVERPLVTKRILRRRRR